MSDNQSRLLEHAERLFAARGLDAVGVQEIVEACGLTKPTLYHYFGNREGLIRALFDRGFRRLGAALDTQPSYQGDLPKTLKEQWSIWFSVVDAAPDFFRVSLSASFLPPKNPIQDWIRPHLETLQGRMTDLFLAAVPLYGNMRDREALLASTWLGLLWHWTGAALADWTYAGRRPARDEILRPFLYGLFT